MSTPQGRRRAAPLRAWLAEAAAVAAARADSRWRASSSILNRKLSWGTRAQCSVCCGCGRGECLLGPAAAVCVRASARPCQRVPPRDFSEEPKGARAEEPSLKSPSAGPPAPRAIALGPRSPPSGPP